MSLKALLITLLAASSVTAQVMADNGAQDLVDKRDGNTQVLPGGLTITWGDAKKGPDVEQPDAKAKRGMQTNTLFKRKKNEISSCGPKSGWTPIYYFGTDKTKYMGWDLAVSTFCTAVDGLIVPPNKRINAYLRYQDDRHNSGPRLTMKNYVPGHIDFEINNKDDHVEHLVIKNDCMNFLNELSTYHSSGKNCYGSNNDDTKGGTWVVGDDKVTYHGLPADG